MTRNGRPKRSEKDLERIASGGLHVHREVRQLAMALKAAGLSIRLIAPWDRAPKRHSSPTTDELYMGIFLGTEMLDDLPTKEERELMMSTLGEIPL